MKTEDVKKLSPMERILYWIKERESIRLKKEAGEPPPWTDDVILQRYRFCNVRRADDKVSRWLLKNWYEPFFGHPNMLLAIALARFVNKPETLEKIGFPEKWDAARIMRIMRKLKAKGETIFNAAYMVRGNDGQDKTESVVKFYVGGLRKKPPVIDPTSMERTWERIECRYGFGSFMAGQVVADARWAITGKWADRMTWAPLGPGSCRGLNRLYGFAAKVTQKEEEFKGMLSDTIETLRESLPQEISGRLEAHDYQNCLCEFSKFEKALWGEGRPKQLYRGGV